VRGHGRVATRVAHFHRHFRPTRRGVLACAIDMFVCRADAELFIEKVRADDAQLADHFWIESVELKTGGTN
jgi:hypothetical protein